MNNEWDYSIRTASRPSFLAANAMYLLAAAGLILVYVVEIALIFAFPELNMIMMHLNSTTAYELLFMLFPVLMYRRKHPRTDASFRLNKPQGKHIVIAVFAAGVGLLMFNYLNVLWSIFLQSLGGRLTGNSFLIGDGPWGTVSALLTMAVMPAVCEEMLFRGMMLGAYERNGSTRAVVVTGLLFALLHGSIEGFPVILCIGLVLGYLAVNTNSILVPMVYHLVHNAGVVMMNLQNNSDAFNPSDSLYYYIGGAAGVAQTCIMLGVTGVIFTLLLLMASSGREMMGLPFGVSKPTVRQRGNWQSSLVLMAGIMTVSLLMLNSLLVMIGFTV